mgnify:CR=1 FL=1
MSDGQSLTFRTIVADPPWSLGLYEGWSCKDYKATGKTEYPLMRVEEIAAIRVPAAEQAHLYLWTLAQHVDWGYQVARAWGFQPVIVWTWAKSGLGAGRFRCNTEHIVVARRGRRQHNPFGNGGRHRQATNGTWFTWPRGRHSEKPGEFFTLVESLSPAPRLELFARTLRHGWTCWGNEVGVTLVPPPTPSGAGGGP